MKGKQTTKPYKNSDCNIIEADVESFKSILKKARKSKVLERHLEMEIKDELYDNLKEIIK